MKKLTFVYNADSGFFNAAIDSFHKTFSPSTYECSLCALTHGFLKEKKRWEKFIKELDFEIEFLHKNEIKLKEYPAVLLDEKVILSKKELEKIKDLDELIRRIKNIINYI
ncbi:MAG: GTPase [Candidatus Woesearchaeota archaeon]